MSGAYKKWPEVKPAAGYRKTTTSDNAGPTATAESVATLDPAANPYLASGGTALEEQKGHLKKAQTVDKSKPIVKGEHDAAGEESATKAAEALEAQKAHLKKTPTADKSTPIVKGEHDAEDKEESAKKAAEVLETKKKGLKKSATNDKSVPIVKGEHDKEAEKSGALWVFSRASVSMSRKVEVKNDEQGNKRLVDEDAKGAERPEKQPRLEIDNRQEGDRRSGDIGGSVGGEGTRNKQPPPLPKGVCHHCGKPGHIRPACPERGQQSVQQQASVCYNCKKEGHKVADCLEPRKECKRWPNCPNTKCPYFHPPSLGGATADRRSSVGSPSRGRAASRSPPRQSLPRRRSRSRERSRDRSPRYSPPRKRDRSVASKAQQQSIRVTGLPRWLESAELGGLFPGTDVVAGAMADQHTAVVIFNDERERDEALRTANKMIFERL